MDHARSLVRQVCGIAGQITWVDDLRDIAIGTGPVGAVADHNTAVIFDWLIREVSHQGISDAVADGYIDRHGNVTWVEIEHSLATNPSCDKLEGYWAFTDCRYHKGFQTCANPAHFPGCPLPRHRLRNGRLNQTAYSLFLFIRDIAGGDIVRWIDRQLAASRQPFGSPGRPGRPASACLWDFRQGHRDGAGIIADGGWGNPTRLVRCRGESFIEPESSIGSRLAIRMGRPATGRVAALTLLLTLPAPSMPADSIRGFRRRFPGSSPAPSGGIAPNRASTFATAIRSMIAAGARTCGAGYTAGAIASSCAPRRKQPKNQL
jgi:hypothetical protein